MPLETLERTYRSPWLPQFGLYKYESTENFGDIYNVSGSSKKFRFGFVLLSGILLVLFLVTYFIIADLSRVERIGVVEHRSDSTNESEISDVTVEYNLPALVVELTNISAEVRDESQVQSESLENVQENGNHSTIQEIMDHDENISYTVKPQKLIFLPSRHLKPPKMDAPVKAKRRRDRPVKRRNQPKPFNHYKSGPNPAPFKRLPTRRFYRDPNLVGFKPMIPGMQDGFRPIMGSYRRPKGTVPTYYQSAATSQHASQLFPYEIDSPLPGHVSTSPISYSPDPFHKFKPPAASDVNLLVVDQPSREQHLKMYNEQYLKNAQTLYQQVVKASRQKLKDLNRDGEVSPGQKQRPFQLMLDVYPLPENEEPATSQRPSQLKYNRFSPYAAKYNALNSINHDKNYDSTYFNRVRFAQIQSKNPHYDHPYYWKINEGQGEEPEAAASETHGTTAGDHPSQLVVHLNLFPKKKKKMKGMKKNKRPFKFDYDANDEDDDDDNSEYFRRASIESDEFQKMDTNNEGVIDLTSKNYNGRPLRSTKVKLNKRKKSSKEGNEDASKENSKPIAINFNFPPSTKIPKGIGVNCSETQIETQKMIPMMDGNDDDVPHPTKRVPTAYAHDFPYRFASMPPAYIRQRPVRPQIFPNRMLKLNANDNTRN